MATKQELITRIEELEQELSKLEEELESIEINEEKEAILRRIVQIGVEFAVGKEFTVTPAIHAYAEERGFGQGYYPSWLMGQKARILSVHIDRDNTITLIRVECDTGHTYRQGIGLNEEQRSERIKLMSLSTPFPIELIAEALHGS